VNQVDLIAYYGISGLFGPGMFQFRKIDPKPARTDYVMPVVPSCRITLSPEALDQSNKYLKEKDE
jgi:hypothetical protein